MATSLWHVTSHNLYVSRLWTQCDPNILQMYVQSYIWISLHTSGYPIGFEGLCEHASHTGYALAVYQNIIKKHQHKVM